MKILVTRRVAEIINNLLFGFKRKAKKMENVVKRKM